MRIKQEWLTLCERCIAACLEPKGSDGEFPVDEYLDERNSSPFDEDWVASYEGLEEQKSKLTKKDQKLLKDASSKLREKIFKLAFKKTESSDFAAAVSDDAGLICEMRLLEISDVWIHALANEYVQSRLPVGLLKPLDQNPLKL